MTDPYDNTSNTDNPGSTQRGGRHATFSWGAPTGNSQGGGGSQYVTLTQEQAASGNVPWREQGASWEINRGGHSLNTDQDDDPFSQRQSSWDQVDEPFTQPQTHLTRDQFQSLSGLGNETSQTMNPRDRPRKLHQDMQGDTAVDPYDVGDVGDNRGSRTQEEVEDEILRTANPE